MHKSDFSAHFNGYRWKCAGLLLILPIFGRSCMFDVSVCMLQLASTFDMYPPHKNATEQQTEFLHEFIMVQHEKYPISANVIYRKKLATVFQCFLTLLSDTELSFIWAFKSMFIFSFCYLFCLEAFKLRYLKRFCDTWFLFHDNFTALFACYCQKCTLDFVGSRL